MKNRILFENNLEQPADIESKIKKENPVKPNLFQGRTDAETQNAKFPDWDIVPPNQFINPRIKKQ